MEGKHTVNSNITADLTEDLKRSAKEIIQYLIKPQIAVTVLYQSPTQREYKHKQSSVLDQITNSKYESKSGYSVVSNLLQRCSFNNLTTAVKPSYIKNNCNPNYTLGNESQASYLLSCLFFSRV